MLRHVAFPISVGCVLISLTACGTRVFGPQRDAWRAQAEAQCFASGQVRESAGIRLVKPIEGPGVCGLDRPLKVSALDPPAGGSLYAALRRPQVPANETLAPMNEPTGGTDYGDDLTRGLAPVPAGGSSAGMGGWRAQVPDGANLVREPISIPLNRGIVLSCSMIPALNTWLSKVVQPAAIANFGQPIVEMTTLGSYSCRRMLNRKTGKMSEHAFGNAVDVSAFRLADGRVVKVLGGWRRGDPDEQSFWRDAAYGGCSIFNTVLGPGSRDGQHENHLHLDLALHNRSRNVHICRPRVPANWVPAAQRSMAATTPQAQPPIAYTSETGDDFTSGIDPLPGEVDE